MLGLKEDVDRRMTSAKRTSETIELCQTGSKVRARCMQASDGRATDNTAETSDQIGNTTKETTSEEYSKAFQKYLRDECDYWSTTMEPSDVNEICTGKGANVGAW